MRSDSGVPIEELRVDGGASASNLLLQFQADVLGVPVIRPGVSETTALGAAYAAGLSPSPTDLDQDWSKNLGKQEVRAHRTKSLSREREDLPEEDEDTVDPFDFGIAVDADGKRKRRPRETEAAKLDMHQLPPFPKPGSYKVQPPGSHLRRGKSRSKPIVARVVLAADPLSSAKRWKTSSSTSCNGPAAGACITGSTTNVARYPPGTPIHHEARSLPPVGAFEVPS